MLAESFADPNTWRGQRDVAGHEFAVWLFGGHCCEFTYRGDARNSMIDRFIGILGVALALLFGIGQYRWKSIPKWCSDIGILLSGVAIGIAVAPVVWVPGVPEQSALNQASELHLRIVGTNIFVPSNFDPENSTGIALMTRVWSAGKVVGITAWKLDIVPSDAAPLSVNSASMIDDIPLTGGSPGNSVILHKSDSVEQKLGFKPVPREPVDVQILFIVRLPITTVRRGTTRLVIRALDSAGNEFSYSQGALD